MRYGERAIPLTVKAGDGLVFCGPIGNSRERALFGGISSEKTPF